MHPPGEYSVRKQLDALASGELDTATFLKTTLQRFRFDSDESWEVLALLDQYHRLGKIKNEAFREIKSTIGEYALRPRDGSADPVTRPATPELPSEPVPSALKAAEPVETPPTDTVREVRIGDVLRRRYRIEAIIGAGGMGTVYEATDHYRLDVPPNGTRVALKVLHTNITKRTELLVELRREFQHLQSLTHPNIVRAFEFDRDGPRAFYTMELLNGVLLGRLISARQRRPLRRKYALRIIKDVGEAIAYAHAHGIVHGDINPQNVFITSGGEIRVLDFGAAHKLPNAPFAAGGAAVMTSYVTPGYASCQILEGDRPKADDDVFALACVAYLLLRGEPPYGEMSAIEARGARRRPPRPAGLTQRQWRALRNGLRFDRKKRPGNVRSWLEDLDLRDVAPALPTVSDLLEDNPPRPQRYVQAAGYASLVALAALAWYAVSQGLISLPALDARRSTPTRADSEAPVQPPAPAAKTAPPKLAHETPAKQPQAARPEIEPVQSPPAPRRAPTVAAPATSSPSSSAPLVAAHARVEMAADTLVAAPGEHVARVLVRRKGNPRGATSFQWWTESGTAKPDRDYVVVLPRVEHMADGQSTAALTVSLVDARRTQERSFYVEIDAAEGGAGLSGRRLTMVSLPAEN
jgi:serine/threonine protein kinase